MIRLDGEKWIRIIPGNTGEYQLYDALAEHRNSVYLGRLLFDAQMNWIYDGEQLRIPEQEELAGYITDYANEMSSLMDSLKENRIKTLRTNSNDPDFRLLTGELDHDLRERNGTLMDIYDQHNIIEYTAFVVLGYHDGKLAGCGCFKKAFDDAAEIKRMYVRRPFRGRGISAAILNELEDMAVENGYSYTVLETGAKQIEALGLYRKNGYTSMPNYGPYANLPDSICFKKRLV
jgi:GNAT superfamily N-acetyltransferase